MTKLKFTFIDKEGLLHERYIDAEDWNFLEEFRKAKVGDKGTVHETLDTIDVEVVYKDYENNSFSKEYSFGELTAHWLQQGQITLETAMKFLTYKPEHKQW